LIRVPGYLDKHHSFTCLCVNCWNKLADIAERYVKKGALVQVTAEWLRLEAWIDQSGEPQPSMDIDAQRLVLLDRVENSDSGSEEEAPF
jgi:single-stranded DNA-binding protein